MSIRPIPDVNRFLISPMAIRAFGMASAAHAKHKRGNGEPYINHPIRILGILADEFKLPLNDSIISAVFLHDTIEDAGVLLDTIKNLTNDDVAYWVHLLTKPVAQPDMKAMRDKNYYDKIAKAGISAVKLIKVADRIDNLRDMGDWKPARKAKYAKEALDFVLPLAKSDPIASNLLMETINTVSAL